MRVLIVNTSEKTGGAAVASRRIMEALNNNGVKAKMLVRDKETECITVVGMGRGLRQRWHFLWERWCIFCHLHFSRKHLFEVDIANVGTDITSLPEFKEADIIHLSWINQGMLSLRGIRKILDSGKPVVWTMHDIWPATALCHISFDCTKYEKMCCNCYLLPRSLFLGDFAKHVWRKKKNLLSGHGSICFVACSKWLAAKAKRSALLVGHKVTDIPNPIDTRVFCPCGKSEARMRAGLPRDMRLVLFVAQRITNVNKGVSFFIEAFSMLKERSPEVLGNTGIVVLGAGGEEFEHSFSVPVFPINYVSDVSKIVDIYNSVDLFVTSSLSENLPNTIMEAMACGVPCVGFNVGGIPEMIDHLKNGYVAEYKNASDLATGIKWVLAEADVAELKRNALHKVATCYSQQSVAMKYIEIYNQAIAYRRYRL